VKAAASELGIPVAHEVDAVLASGAELGVVVAFGKLIRRHVLEALPMVNLHFSLLPRWRGAAPVERAILAGDDETGVCLMALDVGLDTGPVYECRRLAIGHEETAEELRGRLVEAGTDMLRSRLEAGLGPALPQEGDPTYATKLTPEDLRLEWSWRAVDLHRRVRVGRAWTTLEGRRLLVLRARVGAGRGPGEGGEPGRLEGVTVTCGGGTTLELVEVQAEGRSPQGAADWRRGLRATGPVTLGT
jgi:methionyl-tRNA formyltransferase